MTTKQKHAEHPKSPLDGCWKWILGVVFLVFIGTALFTLAIVYHGFFPRILLSCESYSETKQYGIRIEDHRTSNGSNKYFYYSSKDSGKNWEQFYEVFSDSFPYTIKCDRVIFYGDNHIFYWWTDAWERGRKRYCCNA